MYKKSGMRYKMYKRWTKIFCQLIFITDTHYIDTIAVPQNTKSQTSQNSRRHTGWQRFKADYQTAQTEDTLKI